MAFQSVSRMSILIYVFKMHVTLLRKLKRESLTERGVEQGKADEWYDVYPSNFI